MARRDIRDTRVIITGASSGIGRALAVELAAAGAKLVVTARREDRLNELAEEIGKDIEIVVGDITDERVRAEAIEKAQTSFGGLDILVNNAGVGAMGLFEEADPSRRHLMEVNYFALVEMTRIALPILKRGNKPIIVNVGSILGHVGAPHNSEYAATKFAVAGFSKALRAELSGQGVDVLVVSPGTTATEFFDVVVEKTSAPAWPEHAPVTAESVAKATVKAIRRGKHEIIPYRWGKLLCLMNRFSPWMVEKIMARYV